MKREYNYPKIYEMLKKYGAKSNSKLRERAINGILPSAFYCYKAFFEADKYSFNFNKEERDKLLASFIKTNHSASLLRNEYKHLIDSKEREIIFQYMLSNGSSYAKDMLIHYRLDWKEERRAITVILESYAKTKNEFDIREITTGEGRYVLNAGLLEWTIEEIKEKGNIYAADYIYDELPYMAENWQWGEDTIKYFRNKLEPLVIALKLMGGENDGIL